MAVLLSFPKPSILIFKIAFWISRSIQDVPNPNPKVVNGVCPWLEIGY